MPGPGTHCCHSLSYYVFNLYPSQGSVQNLPGPSTRAFLCGSDTTGDSARTQGYKEHCVYISDDDHRTPAVYILNTFACLFFALPLPGDAPFNYTQLSSTSTFVTATDDINTQEGWSLVSRMYVQGSRLEAGWRVANNFHL